MDEEGGGPLRTPAAVPDPGDRGGLALLAYAFRSPVCRKPGAA